ncbi:alanine racemase [Paenibacillus marinisediminis]
MTDSGNPQFLSLTEVETPFLLIDESRVDTNVSRMAERAAQLGVKLRPHIKTHKMPYFAQKQLEQGASGITAAKVSEAEVMAAHGMKDIFIAYPLVTASKIERAFCLMKEARILLGLDSIECASRLEQAAAAHHLMIEVRIEVDTGLRRTGIKASQMLELAQHIANSPHLKLQGIYTFRGAIFQDEPTMDLKMAGHDEGQTMVRYAEMLREVGHDIQDVSVGSSPTGLYTAEVPGVTEIRPGTYIFNDRMQAAFGAAALHDCAASVIATVVSCPHEDLIVIDGGSKAFATDVPPNTAPLFLQGYGHIVGMPSAVLQRLSEEHGIIQVPPGHPFRIGDRVSIIPNHICSTVNLYNEAWSVNADVNAGSVRKLPISARGHSW